MSEQGQVTARLEPIPTLPIFFKLSDKRVLLVGGEPPVAWKAELLLAAGARLLIVAAEPCPAVRALARDAAGSTVTLAEREWATSDLPGAALAIAAIADDAEAARFRDAAHGMGVPVNVIDKPAFCDFQFGTLVVRSPLVVAITTDGAAPVLGQALRVRLESLLPATLRAWAAAARLWRDDVQERGWGLAKRRRFWSVFADQALAPDAPAPDAAVKARCFAAVDREPDRVPTALTLVGCGSGDPDDMTLAGVRELQNASLVLHDADVPAATIHLARREAAKHVATSDADVLAFLSDQPWDGRIVWLGLGDPERCACWRHRRRSLAAAGATPGIVRGLERCPEACMRHPPADARHA